MTVHLSADRRSALVAGDVNRSFSFSALQASVSAVGVAQPAVTTALTGAQSDGGNDLRRAELLSLPVTLLVLLLAFGTFVAALVPVLLAASAVIAAFGLLGPISQVFPLDDSVKTVVLLLGMAVGVDYALFYVVRSREERRRGLPSHEALERTARTSGRTVVIAGTTVATAVAAQYAIGSAIFNGIASGTIAVIACAVAGSVTVLPAVLELLGPRIDRGRIPFLPHLHADSSDARFWPALIDRVLRRPVVCARGLGRRARGARPPGPRAACRLTGLRRQRAGGRTRRQARSPPTFPAPRNPRSSSSPGPRSSGVPPRGPCAVWRRSRRRAGSRIRRSRSIPPATAGRRPSSFHSSASATTPPAVMPSRRSGATSCR